MQIPDYMHGQVANALAAEQMASDYHAQEMDRRSKWAVVLGLIPFQDGDHWCVLLGDNLQVGIAAFGDSPEQAINNFDLAMREQVKPAAGV